MSSVRDRIRNLQQATQQTASAQPADPTEKPQPLAQLANQFDSAPSEASTPTLGARAARFDSQPSQSLQERLRHLEGASGGAEKGDGLQKARAMFEAVSKEKAVEVKPVPLKDALPKRADAAVKTPRGAGNELLALGLSKVKSDASDGATPVSSRAAMFERNSSPAKGSEKVSVSRVSATSEPANEGPPKSSPKQEPLKVEPVAAQPVLMGKSEESLKEELAQVKKANEQLVSTLLQLTAAFKRLEGTRETLQKKISELEKNSK